MIRPFKSHTPVVDASAYVDTSAQVIGDVEIGAESSVWMNVVIRGDVNRIRIGRRSNIQDLTMVHVMRDTHPTTIGDEVTVGHSAVIHGSTIEDRVLVGMAAVLLNGVHVGHDSVIAAGTLLTEGTRIPPRSLVMGRPGTVKRELTDQEVAEIRWYADNYVAYRLDYPVMNTGPARGMRDFLPEDVRRRHYVIGVIADVYQKYGFEPLETPSVENIETLLGKYGEEGDKLIFKILKRGEGAETGQADLALRYDLTVPLARVVAEYRARLPKFFKRYQVQPVWRADRPQKGRFREFYQCDVDAIGSTSMVVEAELLGAAGDVLSRLGFTAYTIRLNHRGVLAGMLDAGGVPDALHNDALVALDKLDKIGRDGVAAELQARGVPETGAGMLLEFFASVAAAHATADADPAAFNHEVLRRLEGLLNGARPEALADLRQVVALVGATATGGHLRLDPSLARGLSYYTGAIFEIAVPDLAGSLGGGGRYDNLIGMFLGDQVPACGISLGLERILVVMGERDMFPPGLGTAPADVMVTIWNLNGVPDALSLAAELRSAGLRVEVYPDADKIGKQLKYASSRAIPFVTVVGDDELAKGVVTLKTLATGEQQVVPRADVADVVKRIS